MEKTRNLFRMVVPIHGKIPLGKCDFTVVDYPITSLSETFSYYDKFRAYIEHEDGLISSRLTWSLTVHGFLFAIYGLLVGKIADELGQIDKNPTVLLERMVSAMFLLQVPIAAFGVLVGHQSRNAIAAGNNAIQHLIQLAESSEVLKTQDCETVSETFIDAGDEEEATPKSMAKICKGTRLLIDPGVKDAEEIVTVIDSDGSRFQANFANQHKEGALIRVLGPVLLPKVVAGGSKDLRTSSARAYHLSLPAAAMAVWIVLCGISILVGVASLWCPGWFYSMLGVAAK